VDKVERVQRRFLRYALRNLGGTDIYDLPPYEHMCALLRLESLVKRRSIALSLLLWINYNRYCLTFFFFMDNIKKTHKKNFRIYLKSIEENTINTTSKRTISHYSEVAKIESDFIKIKKIITDKMAKIIYQNIKHTFDTTSKIIGVIIEFEMKNYGLFASPGLLSD
jgi:hypothetical protein